MKNRGLSKGDTMDPKTQEIFIIIAVEIYAIIGVLISPPPRLLFSISHRFKTWGKFSRYYFFVYAMFIFLWPAYACYWYNFGINRKLKSLGIRA